MTGTNICSIVVVLALFVHVQASAKKSIKEDRIFALKQAGDLFFLEANVDGQFGNFILDSGSEEVVLNEVYFRADEVDLSRVSGSMNGSGDVARIARIERLEMGDLHFENIRADVTDLSAIENQKGLKVFGLMSLAFFEGYSYELDLPNRLLILRDDETFIPTQEAILDVPLRISDGVASFEVMVNDVKLRFSLDTGAELNVLHNKLSDKVYKGMRILRTSDLLSSDGSRNQVLLAQLKEVRIQERPFEEMLTFVLDMVHIRSVQGYSIDGSLGYPFLSRGRFIIDTKSKRLYMFPSVPLE